MHNNTIFESLYVCKLTSHQISLPQKYKFLCNFKKCNFTQLPGTKSVCLNSSFIFACLKKKIEKGDNMSEFWGVGVGGGGQLSHTKFFNISFLKLAMNISVTCTTIQYLKVCMYAN